MTLRLQSALLDQKPWVLRTGFSLPPPLAGSRRVLGAGASGYLDFQAANRPAEFIYVDHLFPFHLFPAARTGLLSRRQEWVVKSVGSGKGPRGSNTPSQVVPSLELEES